MSGDVSGAQLAMRMTGTLPNSFLKNEKKTAGLSLMSRR